MRKWTYLVATLLMAGTTATFTGCIDTDEPEGIVDLRGAKSELIKAQAAVKLVEVEWQKAKVAEQELVNKSKELDNQYKEYDVQMHALDVELKKLEVERAQAVTEQAKAEAEAKIAEANRNKAAWENKMAEEAEIFKAAMLNYQTLTAQAQEAHDNAMKLIEAGKLLLTDGEKAIINKAQLHLESAATAMNGKYLLLKKAQIEYNAAITDPTTPTLESLQALVKQAQVAVEKNEIILKEKENLLALAEDFDAAEWDAKSLEMKKKMSEYQSLQDKAEVEKVKIEKSADYKAAVQNVTDKEELQAAAQKVYFDDSVNPNEGAKADSTAATKADRIIKEYKSEPVDNGLKSLFASETSFDGIGYNKSTGIFSYSKGTYTQEKYDADLKEDEADRTNDASIRIKTVNTWITVLTDYTVDENGVAWNENQKAKLAEKADKAGKTFETAYSYWDIAVKAYTDGTKATPTQPIADLKKVTDDYNKAYTALNKAITDYNAAYDKVYKAAYDKKISELKDAKTLELYVAAFSSDANRFQTYNTKFPAGVEATNAERIAFIKLQILAQAEYEAQDKEVVKYLATDAVKDEAKNVASNAWTPSKEKEEADKALAAANAKVKTAIVTIQPAITSFKTLNYETTGKLSIATPYGQEVVNADFDTKKITDNDGSASTFYEAEEKDNVPTGHIKAIVSDIADDEFAKLTETKVSENIAKTAVTATSNVAFGETIKTTGNINNDRLKPVTVDMVRDYVAANSSVEINEANFGKLGAKIQADDAVKDCQAKIDAAETIKKEITVFEGVLADLKAEIQANTDLMKPFIEEADKARIALNDAKAAVKKAEAERDALTAEVEADIEKYKGLVEDYDALVKEVQKQIEGIKGSATLDQDVPVTVEAILNYWKKAVADQEYIVEKNKQALASAEKNIELFNKGEYTQAYVVEQKKIALDAAKAIYDAAKAVYDDALADVKTILETLTK